MIFWTTIWSVYGLVALAAAIMTFDEQHRTGRYPVLYNMLGYLACLLWPLTIAMVLLATVRRTV
jgi:hypothetical protein